MSTLEQLKEKNRALEQRVEKLEQRFENPPVSRRAALAGGAGLVGLSALSGSASAGSNQVGTIGSSSDRVDIFAEDLDVSGDINGVSVEGCRVFLSNDQSTAANNVSKIQFDSKVYDSGSNFDTSTGAWTCPKDGLYAVNLQARFRTGSAGDAREVRIGSNTGSAPRGEGALRDVRSSQPGVRISVSTVNRYSSGETIAGYGRNSDSSDIMGGGNAAFTTFFEVAFLGAL